MLTPHIGDGAVYCQGDKSKMGVITHVYSATCVDIDVGAVRYASVRLFAPEEDMGAFQPGVPFAVYDQPEVPAQAQVEVPPSEELVSATDRPDGPAPLPFAGQALKGVKLHGPDGGLVDHQE